MLSYRRNLANPDRNLFVVLRRAEDCYPPTRVMLVAAAPEAAQTWNECSEDRVESVTMPEAVQDWIRAFCASHPPDEPKRKREYRGAGHLPNDRAQ